MNAGLNLSENKYNLKLFSKYIMNNDVTEDSP